MGEIQNKKVVLTHLYIMLRINETRAGLFTKAGVRIPEDLELKINRLKTEISKLENEDAGE